jgi:hypothetical protein
MFWFVVLSGGLAALFATLGAYSVWLRVLSMALIAALLVICGMLVLYGYKKLFPPHPDKVKGV